MIKFSKNSDKKIVVGLTGGVASGKSFILSIFKKLGAEIVDSDKTAHDMLRKDKLIIRKITGRFGCAVAGKGIGVDRKAVGKIVFNDKKELRWLESVIHPGVFECIKTCIERSRKQVVAVDVPLLFEKKWGEYFDYTVTAFCSRAVQVKRLMKRDRLGMKEAGRMISLQIPLAKKAKRSDFIIDTNYSRLLVSRDVKRVFEEITKGVDWKNG